LPAHAIVIMVAGATVDRRSTRTTTTAIFGYTTTPHVGEVPVPFP
jgi:hypothetical protein